MWKDQKQCYWTKIKESTGLHFSRGSYHRLCKNLTLSTFFSRFLSSYDSSCASIVTCILTLDFLPLLIRLYWAPIYKQGYSPIARALITFANCFFPCKVKHSLVSVRTWISLGGYILFTWSITCFNRSVLVYNAALILQHKMWLSYTYTFEIYSFLLLFIPGYWM